MLAVSLDENSSEQEENSKENVMSCARGRFLWLFAVVTATDVGRHDNEELTRVNERRICVRAQYMRV